MLRVHGQTASWLDVWCDTLSACQPRAENNGLHRGTAATARQILRSSRKLTKSRKTSVLHSFPGPSVLGGKIEAVAGQAISHRHRCKDETCEYPIAGGTRGAGGLMEAGGPDKNRNCRACRWLESPAPLELAD